MIPRYLLDRVGWNQAIHVAWTHLHFHKQATINGLDVNSIISLYIYGEGGDTPGTQEGRGGNPGRPHEQFHKQATINGLDVNSIIRLYIDGEVGNTPWNYRKGVG